jgi:aminoglycoside phosphotransferase family enzyme
MAPGNAGRFVFRCLPAAIGGYSRPCDHRAMANSQDAALSFLADPATHDLHGARVTRIETHGAMVFLAGDRVYKIKRAVKYPYLDFSTLDKREAALQLEEEAGYRAGTLELLTSIWMAPAFTDEIIHIFLGTNLEVGKQNLDQDEVLEVVEWPLEEAMARIQDGTIRDAKTIIGLQMVYRKKKEL